MQDEDGKVSEEDLVGFCRDLQLGCPDDDVSAFFKSLDTEGSGYIEHGAWTRALQEAELLSESVLETRGINSAGLSTVGPAARADETATLGIAATDGVAKDVNAAADQLAAALVYNEMTLEEAFEVLDKDEDSRISMEDLRAAAGSMDLKIEEDALIALHKAMDERSNGLIELDAWCTFLKGRNTADVLRSRGVDERQLSVSSRVVVPESAGVVVPGVVVPGVVVPVPLLQDAYGTANAESKSMQNVSDLIAALLDYNSLSNREGFEAFDVDEDDFVSLSDLLHSAASMNVDASEEHLTAWFQFHNKSGSGLMTDGEWNMAIDSSHPTDVLASRGIVLVVEPAVQPRAGELQEEAGSDGSEGAKAFMAADIDSAASELAAVLRYNDLDLRSGFEALDVDKDQRISLGDLQAAAKGLALEITPNALVALHKAMDKKGNGLVEVDSWSAFLEGRNTDSVLLSRGIDPPVEAEKDALQTQAPAATEEIPITTSTFAHVQTVSDTIAALLDYNHLAHQDGFEAFDVDQDDKISMQDLMEAAESMKLEVSAEVLAQWFRTVNMRGDGMMTFEEWDTALGYANSEDVLRSRGVLLTESEGVDEKELGAPPASAVPDPSAPPLPNADSAPEPANPVAVAAPEEESPSVQPKAVAPETQPGAEAPGAQAVSTVESVGEASIGSLPPTYGNLSPGSVVQRVTDTIAALLQYSDLSPEEGFDEFDKDEDGILSYNDLLQSSKALDMDFHEAELRLWHQSLDTAPTGIIKDVWCVTLSSANAEEVLKSRGVVLEQRATEDVAAAVVVNGDAPGPSAPTVVVPPQEVSDLLAALLKYNNLPFKDAFEDFDQDEDGKISQEDFKGATNALEWSEVPAESLQAWHRHYNKAGDGFMTQEEWLSALDSADADAVLKSRGVATGAAEDDATKLKDDAMKLSATEGSTGVPTSLDKGAQLSGGGGTANLSDSALAADVKVVSRVAEVVAACLQHNDLQVEDGFYAFDMDEDDHLSMGDLVKAATELALDINEADLQQFLTRVEELGGGRSSAQHMAGWKQLLGGVDGTNVLKARGVLHALHDSENPPKPEPVAAAPAPAAAPQAPAVAAQAVPKTEDTVQIQPPAQSPAPQAAARAPEVQAPPAATNPAYTTVPMPPTSADTAQGTPPETPQPQPDAARDTTAAAPALEPAARAPERPAAAASPAVTAQAAPQAPEKAETAAPSWENAVPFTLTLDVDFATIGEHEDFKQGILADVAAAAKVDVKYIKIQALRAGSVIVDLLIAPEVGEPHKVLQDLREQANSPGSRLMTGKLTSKTKGLATPAQPPAASSSAPAKASSGAPAKSEAVSAAHEVGELTSIEKAFAQTAEAFARAAVDSAERARLEQELASVRANSEEMKSLNEEMKLLNEELLEQLDTQSFAHKELQKTSSAHVEELNKEVEQFKTELEELKEQLSTVQFEHAQLQKTSSAHVEELNKDVQRLEGEFKAAKARCVELEVQLAQRTTQSHGAAQEAAAEGKDGVQGDAVPAPESPTAVMASTQAQLAKEIEELTQQLAASKEQLKAQELASQTSLDHVKALEKEVQELKEDGSAVAAAAAALGAADSAGTVSIERENKELKAQVSSLTFQLQELQGAMADTPRERKAQLAQPVLHSGSGSGKKLLETPHNMHKEVSQPPSRAASSDRPSSDKPKRSLLDPPKTTDLPGGDGRRSARSRPASPERLTEQQQGLLGSLMGSPSPPSSPVNSSMQEMTLQRDEALSKCVKSQEEVAQLRTKCASLEQQMAVLKAAADLDSQAVDVVRKATEAALDSLTNNVAMEVSAHSMELAALASKPAVLAGSAAAGGVVAAAPRAAPAAPAPAQVAADQAAAAANKVAELEAQVAALKTQMKEAQKLAAAPATFALAPAKVAEAADQAAAAASRVAELEAQVATLKTQMKEAQKLAEEAAAGKVQEAEQKQKEAAEQAAAGAKKVAELEAQVVTLITQMSESQRLAEEAAAGRGQSTQQLQTRLAEALAAVSTEKVKTTKLEEQVQKLTESVNESKAESIKLKKEKLELFSQVEEAARVQRTSSVEAEQEAQTLKTSARTSASERDRLKEQVQALEVQVAEMRGKETALQDQLSVAAADLATAKDACATMQLEQHVSKLETARLLDAQQKLQARLDEFVAQKSSQDTELELARKELEEFNGTRYGEMESLKAKVEILRQEKEALLMEKKKHGIAAGIMQQQAASQDATAASASPNVSPQRKRNDAYFGAMEADLAVSSGALSNVEKLLKNAPLADVESEISRVREERASSPHKARPVTMSPPPPPQEEYFGQWQVPSPSRRARQDHHLQENLDLLAAALSYNGLTVASGYSAFDQDRDGRVSERDLRKSLSDLELVMQHEELRMLFDFMDADRDGYISEVEWSTALRDADPFSVLASQGVRTLEIKVPPDADAHLQAVEAFESIKQELAKSLAAQARMKTSLDQAQRGRAELEADLRRIRQTRSELEAELRAVRSEMMNAARTGREGSRGEVEVNDSGEVAELRRLNTMISSRVTERDQEISALRQQLAATQGTTTTRVERIVDTSGEDSIRRDLASKEERIADLLRQLAVATQVKTTTTQLAATQGATTVEKIVDTSGEDALRRDLASKEERIADLLRQLAAVQELTGAKNSSEGAREKMLHDELRALKDGVAERESAISQLKTRIADLEKAELSHSSEVHALKGKYAEVQELFEKACAERNAISSKVKNAESAEALAKNSLEHKTQDLVRVETELKALQEQMRDREETGHRMIELQARVTAREADILKLKEGETTAARELARVKGELEAQTEVNGKQIAEMQALAKDAKLCVIEREHKMEAQGKLRDALAKIQGLEEQVEQIMVLRASDESRNREVAYASVQDSLADKDAEIQRVLLQLEEARGDLEAARRDREAMVARQTQSLQDELLRVNEELKAREIQVADLEQQRVQLKTSAATKVDSNIVEEWKRSAALKEAEIEELRRNRNSDIEAIRTSSEAQAASLAQLRAQIAAVTEERNALDRRAKAVADELKLSREENDNLKRQLKDLREGKQSLDSDVQMLRSKSVAGDEELRAANAELAELRATCVQLRAVADQFAVMRERVRAAEAEVALANTRLEQLDSVQRNLERKERDLMEERERCDRLRAELQDLRGGGGARGEWESKNAMLEARFTEVESARRQAEFDLTQAHNDRAAMDIKISELGEELASARVRITSLESSVKMAQSLGGESNSQLEERIRDLTSSKERYERKYRETQQELKEAQEALARSRRRVQELQDALDTSVGPNDSVALRFFCRPPARVSLLLAQWCMF